MVTEISLSTKVDYILFYSYQPENAKKYFKSKAL